MTISSSLKRSYPFLPRNLVDGVGGFSKAGNTLSPAILGPKQEPGVEDDAPPLKRRKLEAGDVVSIDPKALMTVQLAAGTTRKKPIDQLLLPVRQQEKEHMLRIEALKIVHKSSARIRVSDSGDSRQPNSSTRDMSVSRARCKLTITYGSPAISGSEIQVLYCQSQMCEIRSFRTSVGPYPLARIYLKNPFYIPQESIFINHEDDGSFDFADMYNVKVELESAGDRNWPPLNLVDGVSGQQDGDVSGVTSSGGRLASPMRWVLMSSVTDLFSRSRAHGILHVKKTAGKREPIEVTDFMMDVDVRWTTGIEPKPLEKGVLPTIVAVDEDEQQVGHEPADDPTLKEMRDGQTSGFVNGLEMDQDEDDEETTPNRSLRHRGGNKIYNLKVLSAKAQGKELRRRKRAQKEPEPEPEAGRVLYSLPAENVILDSYRCVACGIPHQNLAQLQFHQVANHGDYNFILQSTTRDGLYFEVAHNYEVLDCPSKTYQLGRPTMPLDLNKFTNEYDVSWYTNRLGPFNDNDHKLPANSRMLQVRPSEIPSVEMLDAEQADDSIEAPPLLTRQLLTVLRQKQHSNPKSTIIPESKHPFFEPISWVQLEPGTKVSKPAADSKWLLQKHQESLADFTDVTPAEKEICSVWDAFVMGKRITSEAYLPRAWLEFVKEKASWLVASKPRMAEFAKHYTYLLGRDVLDDKTAQQGFQILRNAKEERIRNVHDPEAEELKPSPKATLCRQSVAGCAVCGLPALGARLLLCGNESCPRRKYHADCAEKSAIMAVDATGWLCDACYEHPAMQSS